MHRIPYRHVRLSGCAYIVGTQTFHIGEDRYLCTLDGQELSDDIRRRLDAHPNVIRDEDVSEELEEPEEAEGGEISEESEEAKESEEPEQGEESHGEAPEGSEPGFEPIPLEAFEEMATKNFRDAQDYARMFGVTDRSKDGLIDEYEAMLAGREE